MRSNMLTPRICGLRSSGAIQHGGSISNVKVVKCPHDKINEDGRCAYCNKTGIKATVGGTTYDDVSKAVEDWLANGGTLKLYDDYTATNGTWSIGSGSHTINLNGHRMSVQGDGTFKPLTICI